MGRESHDANVADEAGPSFILPNRSLTTENEDAESNKPIVNMSAFAMRRISRSISRQWDTDDLSVLSVQRRLRDFHFARSKRRAKYGNDRPWGIMGLYDHLAAIRLDIEWAEDAAWRRKNEEP